MRNQLPYNVTVRSATQLIEKCAFDSKHNAMQWMEDIEPDRFDELYITIYHRGELITEKVLPPTMRNQ